MRNNLGPILAAMGLATLLFAPHVSAQSRSITQKEFNSYIEISRRLTESVSFRRSVRIFSGDTPTGDWVPYSSLVEESEYPDRSHLAYRTPMQREFIRIGKYLYSRTDPNSKWDRSEDKGWASIPNNPAGLFGFPPLSEFSIVVGDEKAATVKVVGKRSADADEKHTGIVIFIFDSKGILSEKEEIGWNGWSFVRRIEDYEYDPNIKVEVPIN